MHSRARTEGSAPLPRELDDALIAARPRLGRLGSPVIYFPVIPSTNDVAAALASRSECEGAVVIAEAQSAGRGRRGREWFSPPGGGVYVSIVLTPERSRVDGGRATSLLTLTAGVALAEAVEAATGLAVHVKWPNDLCVARRKLGGILAEAVAGDPQGRSVLDTPERYGANASASGGGAPRELMNVILGYGINVGPISYPPELRDRATSIESELGRRVDRAQVLVESIASLARRYDDLLEGRFDAILEAWRARAPASVGARVTWTTAPGGASGVTAGIDDEGALLVLVSDRIERIVAGEVTWL